jgi:hypothetical protein
MQDAVACRLMTFGLLCLGEFDDQLLPLDLDTRDMGVDEHPVINRFR